MDTYNLSHTIYSSSCSLCIASYILACLLQSTSGVFSYVSLFLLARAEWTPHNIFQIHDSDMITGHAFEKIINGPAHHTLHHLYFTVNYGQVGF